LLFFSPFLKINYKIFSDIWFNLVS
jgi:hypothetical protein